MVILASVALSRMLACARGAKDGGPFGEAQVGVDLVVMMTPVRSLSLRRGGKSRTPSKALIGRYPSSSKITKSVLAYTAAIFSAMTRPCLGLVLGFFLASAR